MEASDKSEIEQLRMALSIANQTNAELLKKIDALVVDRARFSAEPRAYEAHDGTLHGTVANALMQAGEPISPLYSRGYLVNRNGKMVAA